MQSVGGYGVLAVACASSWLSIGGYSIPAIPTQSAAYTWLRGDGVRMAWGGCVGMAGMPYPPINTSASTDADVCADRCRCLRRTIRMSAPTDADVCAERYRCLRRTMRTMQEGLSCSGKRQSRALHVFLPHY